MSWYQGHESDDGRILSTSYLHNLFTYVFIKYSKKTKERDHKDCETVKISLITPYFSNFYKVYQTE